MKKVNVLLILMVILLGALSLYKLSNKYNLNILKSNIDCTIVVKGCEKARALSADDDKNIYIAFSDYIKSVDREGKEKLIYKEKSIDIEDMVYYDNSLIYISEDGVYRISLSDSGKETLCSNVPLSGNDLKRRLIIDGDTLYIAIGARTNSGISEGDYADIPPVEVTLNGNNYGAKLTGAFKKYGVKSENGEKIPAGSIGNAAIYTFNLKNKKLSLYSTGIRGVKGMTLNSKGEIEAIFSGMNNEGLRAVNRDKDYIYKIEKGQCYGWPDFSGGDPIDSPRFKGDEIIKPLLKTSKDRNVSGPIYQSEELNSIQGIAADKYGKVLDKDTVMFWNSKSEKICTLSVQKVYKEILKLKSSSNIENIICTSDEFLLLDNEAGCVYSVHKKNDVLGFKVPVVIIFFIFILSVSLLIIILYKLISRNKK